MLTTPTLKIFSLKKKQNIGVAQYEHLKSDNSRHIPVKRQIEKRTVSSSKHMNSSCHFTTSSARGPFSTVVMELQATGWLTNNSLTEYPTLLCPPGVWETSYVQGFISFDCSCNSMECFVTSQASL